MNGRNSKKRKKSPVRGVLNGAPGYYEATGVMIRVEKNFEAGGMQLRSQKLGRLKIIQI